jgi:uncharacterized protein with PQ loop repeat
MNGGLHHYHLRTRLYKNLEKFPHPKPLKRFFDHLMYGVGIMAPFVLLPQILTLYETKDASGFSIATWGLLACINVLWAFYGALHRERPIMLANIVMFLFNFTIVLEIFMYQ